MAFTKKKFIDITGLSTFRNSLLGTSIEEANKTTENKTATIKAIAEYVDSEVNDLSSAVTTGLAEKVSSVSYDSTNKKLTYNKGGSTTTDIVETSSLKADIDAMQYGTCSTTASTQAKVVACPNFKLVTGARIAVKFTVTNTASSPTLNVNNTGAKAIYYRGSAISAGYLATNRTYEFVYNGTQYELIGDIDTNSNTVPQGYCSTSAGTAAKTVTCSSYSLLAKSYLMVVMAYANTSATALTLNVNGKDAKPIYINGTVSSASNYTLPAGSYLTYYDGTNFYFRTDGKITGSITGSASSATTAGSATNDSDGNKISTTYVKGTTIANSTALGLVKSSTTGTTKDRDYNVEVKSDGTMKVNVPWTDSDTKYSVMTGATASANGTSGLVPAPASGEQTSFLRGDGTWVVPTDTNTTYTVASGDSNGQIKVTPSSGSAYNVSVKGLGSSAYTESSAYATSSHNHNDSYYTKTELDTKLNGKSNIGHTHTIANITDLGTATSSTIGLVKSSTTGTTANRDYNIEVSSLDGTMKVNVPWTDTQVTSTASNTTKAYLVGSSSASTGTGTLIKDSGVYLDTTAGQLVATTFKGALSGNASTATKATQDSAGQQINTTYIKALSASGQTVTYTKGNGTTSTITTQDTKNTAGSTDTSSKIFLIGATSQASNPQTYSDNQVYATSGQLDANKVRVAEKVTLQYNSTTESLDFVFA